MRICKEIFEVRKAWMTDDMLELMERGKHTDRYETVYISTRAEIRTKSRKVK